jgi:hypothetical protein
MSWLDEAVDFVVACAQGLTFRTSWTGFTQGGKMGNWKFFTDAEVAGLQGNLPAMLDMARGTAGVPFVITFTTGGQHCGNSAHYKGLAVDLGLGHLDAGFPRDNVRGEMLRGLYAAGFKRVEIAPAHLHVDIGQPPEYPSPVTWIGTDS